MVSHQGVRIVSAFALAAGLWMGPRFTLAADWPQWRGMGRDGVAKEEKLPTPVPAALKELWKIEVGSGYSSPVIAKGQVNLLMRDRDNEIAVGYNAADGKELWRDVYAAAYSPISAAAKHGGGPFPTSTIDGDLLFTFGMTQTLSAYDRVAGKMKWRYEFGKDYAKPTTQFGTSSSPIVVGDLVVVEAGETGNGAVVAFDKNSGVEKWRNKLDGPGYASLVTMKLGEKTLMVGPLEKKLVALNPADGAVVWETPFVGRSGVHASTPVASDKILYISSQGQGLQAWKFKDEDPSKPEMIWKNDQHASRMSSPVLNNGRIFIFGTRNSGYIGAVNAADGVDLWESPGRYADNVLIVSVGDHLLVLDNEGKIHVVDAKANEYKEVALWETGAQMTYAHLAMADGKLYVKGQTSLACYGF